MKLTRELYIPKQYKQKLERDGTIVYIIDELEAKGFGGKRAKPDFYYKFKSAQSMTKYINDYFDGQQQHAEVIINRRKEQSAPHTLKIGDILYSSWGYDQTNVDFFQVTGLKGTRGVFVRPLAHDTKQTGFMTGQVMPVKDKFIGPETYHIARRNSIAYNPSDKYLKPGQERDRERHYTASLWDGRPEYESWYA